MTFYDPNSWTEGRIRKLRDAANRLRACRSNASQSFVGDQRAINRLKRADSSLTACAEYLERAAEIIDS